MRFVLIHGGFHGANVDEAGVEVSDQQAATGFQQHLDHERRQSSGYWERQIVIVPS